MMKRILTAAALVAVAAPVAAQQHDNHGAAGSAAGHAVCMVGMMPGGMQHGAGGMQHGAGSMQHGAGAEGGAAAEGGAEHAGITLWSHEFMALMHHAGEFGLTAEQTQRIEQVRAGAQASCNQHMMQAKASEDAATKAWAQATPDVATFEARMRDAATHAALAQVAVGKAVISAIELLTPAQRTKLAEERAEHAEKAAAGGH